MNKAGRKSKKWVDGAGNTPHTGSIAKLTRKSETARTKRKRSLSNSNVAQLRNTYAREGLIAPADGESSVHVFAVSTPRPRKAGPMDVRRAIDLYMDAKNPEDLEKFFLFASWVLEVHICSDNRCLCGKLRRHRERVLDDLAVRNHVTPWLPNPRVQVPGSACSAER